MNGKPFYWTGTAAVWLLVLLSNRGAIVVADPRQEAPAAEEERLSPQTVSSSALLGRTVSDSRGEVVGRIDRLLIDPATGNVVSVVLNLLGQRDEWVAVPWNDLSIEAGRIALALSPDQLDNAARLPRAEVEPPAASLEAQAPAPDEEPIRIELIEDPTPEAPRSGYAPEPGAMPRPSYDPSTFEVVQGTVVGTATAPIGDGQQEEVAAIVETGSGPVRLQLGPSWYLEQVGLRLAPDMRVVARGSRFEEEGTTILVVSEITIDQRTVELRGRDGSPRWSRFR